MCEDCILHKGIACSGGDPEYVVVETEGGACVGVIPDGASIPNDVFPDQEPFTPEQAEQVVENLNNPD